MAKSSHVRSYDRTKVEQVLKQVAEAFVKQQPYFDHTQQLRVLCDPGEMYFILYGSNISAGIAGFGETAEAALSDFKENWSRHKNEQ
jgi:hypothetical protein